MYRRPTGKNVGPRGLVAQALLANGHSLQETARIARVSKGTARALKRRPSWTDPEKVREIRTYLQDKALIKTDLLIDSIDKAHIKRAKLGEIAAAARAVGSMCLYLEPTAQPTLTLIQNNYGLQSSHSASQATMPTTTGSEVKAQDEKASQ